jgi:hypothetical protein
MTKHEDWPFSVPPRGAAATRTRSKNCAKEQVNDEPDFSSQQNQVN